MKLNGYAYKYKSVLFNNPQKLSAGMQKPAGAYFGSAHNLDTNYIEKLNSIISPQEFNKYYDSICAYLNLDIKPKLSISNNITSKNGGGFTFSQNQINLCAEDLVCSDYKIIGVKGNKKQALIEPLSSIPLFASKEAAEKFVKNAETKNNYGFDYIYITPSSAADKKRLVIQKLAHELIHAQQHMILRQTEGIGVKEIIKAWTHIMPKNEEEAQKLNIESEKNLKQSYWADKTLEPAKIPKNSPLGRLAYKWLNAVKNYSLNDNSYYKNAVEQDAYKRSAEYAQMLFGGIAV